MPLPTSTYKKLSVNQWLEIVNLAEEGTAVAKIARMFSVSISVIYSGLKKRGVVIGGAAKSASAEAASRDLEILITRVKTTKDKYYTFNNALVEMMMRRVIEANKDNKMAGMLDELKSFKLALSSIKDGTSNAWRILGLDKDNSDADKELPELPIRELTENEVQAIRDRQSLDDDLEGLESLPEEIDDIDDDLESEGIADEESAF
jgi:IS30 family transposase